MNNRSGPIGIFDSGVGGLTVLKLMKSELPAENFIYLADLANVPYGNKSPAQINMIVSRILDFMMEKMLRQS
ncbi:MAG: hypothetical protein J7M18_06895 [Candidatus Eremiobacteraeota bacterium]|nr:hypothetical protein [Candidatus Eremiobacteraeota bacterium]